MFLYLKTTYIYIINGMACIDEHSRYNVRKAIAIQLYYSSIQAISYNTSEYTGKYSSGIEYRVLLGLLGLLGLQIPPKK
jgi:hypothetical protein